jgi:hypothetical protein
MEQKRNVQITMTFETLIVFLHTSGEELFNLCGIDTLTNNSFITEIEQKKTYKPLPKIKQIDVKKYLKKRLSSSLEKEKYNDIFIKKIAANEQKLKEAITNYFNKRKWSTDQIESLAEQLTALQEKILKIEKDPKILEDQTFQEKIILPATALFHFLVKIFNDAKIII